MSSEKYHIEIHKAQGLVIGDGAKVEQRFQADAAEGRPRPQRLSPAERRAYLEAELGQYERNLAELRLQKARYGLDVPLRLLNDIREAETAIERIKTELETLR